MQLSLSDPNSMKPKKKTVKTELQFYTGKKLFYFRKWDWVGRSNGAKRRRRRFPTLFVSSMGTRRLSSRPPTITSRQQRLDVPRPKLRAHRWHLHGVKCWRFLQSVELQNRPRSGGWGGRRWPRHFPQKMLFHWLASIVCRSMGGQKIKRFFLYFR